MTRRTLPTLAASAAALLLVACAPAVAPPTVPSAGPSAVPVAVDNQSHEMVNVFFVTESGARFRIGAVPPLSAAAFAPRLGALPPGYFHAHRLGELDRSLAFGPLADPRSVARGRIQITIAAVPQFDSWLVRD